jgi:hypothetical protein
MEMISMHNSMYAAVAAVRLLGNLHWMRIGGSYTHQQEGTTDIPRSPNCRAAMV